MPKKTSLEDMRDWLRRFESGEPVASIAKKTRHDTRTIDRGILDARKDRDSQAARGDMLREALRRHQGDLTEVIEALRSAAAAIAPMGLALPFGELTPGEISLHDAVAHADGEGGWTVVLGLENTVKWELFQEHMKRDAFWKALAGWKKTLAGHISDRLALNKHVSKVLREGTGLEMLEGVPEAGKRFLYPSGVQAISHQVLKHALTVDDHVGLDRELNISGPNLNFGDDRIPVLTSPSAEAYTAKVLDVFKDLQKPAVTNKPAASYREVEEAARKLDRAVEELILMRMVPGRCPVCRRLGV